MTDTTDGTKDNIDSILFDLEWEATFEKMNIEKRTQFKAKIEALCTKRETIARLEGEKAVAVEVMQRGFNEDCIFCGLKDKFCRDVMIKPRLKRGKT